MVRAMARGHMQWFTLLAASVLSALVAHGSFDTEWECSTACNIILPLHAYGRYNFNVDWHDGSPLQAVSGTQSSSSISHWYPSDGTYNISITGELWRFRFANAHSKLLLTKVLAWGEVLLGNLGHNFHGCKNLIAIPSTEPPGVINYADMFNGCDSLNDPSISTWNTAMVTEMRSMFQAASVFNQPLGAWEVGRVTTMWRMFNIASDFSKDLSSWDVCRVTQYLDFDTSSGLTTPQMPAFGGAASCAPTVAPTFTTTSPTGTTVAPSSTPTTSPVPGSLLVIQAGAVLKIVTNGIVRVGL